MAKLQVLNGATAATSEPTASSDGVKLWKTTMLGGGLWRGTDRALFKLTAPVSAGTTGTIKIRLWGYDGQMGKWAPLGVGGSTKGTLDASSDMEETQTDEINHAEIIEGLRHFDRIYAQVVSASNIASPGAEAWLFGGTTMTGGANG